MALLRSHPTMNPTTNKMKATPGVAIMTGHPLMKNCVMGL